MRATILALLTSLALVAGCAKANPYLVASQSAVHDGIQKVDAELRKVCQNPGLSAPCADARPVVLELVNAGDAFSKSVLNQDIRGLNDVIIAAGRLGEKVKALPSGETSRIVVELARVLAQASLLAGGN